LAAPIADRNTPAINYFSDAFSAAIGLVFQFDPDIYDIVWTSLKISLIATFFASLLGVLPGVWTAISRFPGKHVPQHLLNTLMAMPAVMIGLIFYGLLSRRGPLRDFGLLYTGTAVILVKAPDPAYHHEHDAGSRTTGQ
jgi:tungstate transport system permease protein